VSIMKTNCFYLKVSVLVIFLLTCLASPSPAAINRSDGASTPSNRRDEVTTPSNGHDEATPSSDGHDETAAPSPPHGKEVQQIQQDILNLENALKMLSDEKQRSVAVSQIESLLSAKKELLAQKTGVTSIKGNGQPLNFIQLFQKVKKILFHLLELLKEKAGRLSRDYAQLKSFFSSRENLFMLLDIVLKLLVSFVLGLILWFFSRKLTRKLRVSFQKREKGFLHGKIKTLLFRIFLEFHTLAILFFLAWVLLKSLFREIIVSAVLSVLGAWVVYRILMGLCRLLISPEEAPKMEGVTPPKTKGAAPSAPGVALSGMEGEAKSALGMAVDERLFHLESNTAVYIRTWCRRILLLSLWTFILVKISSLFGLKQTAAVFLKVYMVGIVTSLAIILTKLRGDIQKRFSFTVKEDDPVWKAKMKKAANLILGKAYLVLILSFSAMLILDLLGYEKAARFALYATIKSLLVVALASLVWLFLNKLFQKLSALSAEMVQRYPDLEKKINVYVAWTIYLVRSSIILLTLLIIMTVWNPDTLTFVTRHIADLSILLRIPALVLGSIILIQMITFLVRKMTRRIAESRILKEEATSTEIEKQMNTIGGILYKTAAVFIWSVTGTMVLKELGFSIGPLLAGAGIAGLAVGFGAQNLVRDIISGLFIIGENQIRVGDVAILNGTGGLVEAVNLRTTVLRSLDGTVYIFPNGTIDTVANMTHGFSYYVFDVNVAYKEDTDHVSSVLQEIGDQIAQEEPYKSMILAPFEVIGLDKFDDSAIIIKARIKTQPIKQWEVGREINRRIKKRFDELNIEIPFPHRSIYLGEKTKPLDVNIKSLGEEQISQLKDFIRTTIKETFSP
jgi:small-conductance mechanosensitive channel